MQSFVFQNPTKIIFGENAVEKLGNELGRYGKNILLAYGGGSIKRNGIYDAVISQLKAAGKQVVELPGIMANPRTEKVEEGVALCKEHNIDFILAVGGGSTIDCVKAIAAAARLPEPADFWEYFFLKRNPATEAIPIGTVLTMAATGSEMNGNAVITNWAENKKIGMRGPAVYPQFSVLDPTYTYTLPRAQVAYGVADMLSHLMEAYFSTPDTPNISDDLAEQLMKSIIANARVAFENLEDYTARANLMWAATLGLNGLTTLGKAGDWMSHNIEHSLSAYYDIPHGAGLAIVHPMLLRYIAKDHTARFVQFARNVWGLEQGSMSDLEFAYAGIDALRQFLSSIGCPITLSEVEIPADRLREIADATMVFPTSYHKYTQDDIFEIYQSAL